MKSKNQYIYQDRRNTRSPFDPIDPIYIRNIREPFNLNIKKILVIWVLIMIALLSILY